MSYILEALKKSDRERRQGEIPGLGSDHGKRPDPGKKRQKGSPWKWIAPGIVLLAAVFALVFHRGGNDDAALQEKITALEKSLGQLQEQPGQSVHEAGHPSAGTKAAAPTAAEETGNHPQELPAAVSKQEPFAPATEATKMDEEGATAIGPPPVIKEEAPGAPAQKIVSSAAKATRQEVATEQTDSLPLMQDLPANIRKGLPPLTLAGHVFAENGAKRMIIINNRICREGDMVEDKLYLERIIWEGVVLRYQEVRFRMNL